jgi:hypothetical protein
MPNWCENKLTVRGSKEALINFIKKHIPFKEDDCQQCYLDLKSIIPEPQTPEECDPDFVIKQGEDRRLVQKEGREWFDWYGWHCAYWDTKWNTCDGYFEDMIDDGFITLWFYTAWSPCINPIKKLIEMYPDLEFEYRYFEPGMFFCGSIEKENGQYEEFFSDDEQEIRKFSIEYYFLPEDYWEEYDKEWSTDSGIEVDFTSEDTKGDDA